MLQSVLDDLLGIQLDAILCVVTITITEAPVGHNHYVDPQVPKHHLEKIQQEPNIWVWKGVLLLMLFSWK